MVSVVVVLGVALMLMFATTLALIGKLFYAIMWTLRLILATAIIVAITNNVWVYRAVGFTPMSILFGGKIYGPSLQLINKDKSKKRSQPAKARREPLNTK